MHKLTVLIFLLLALSFAACNDTSSQAPSDDTSSQAPSDDTNTSTSTKEYPLSLLVPLYIYPTLAYDEYDTLIKLKEQNPHLEIIAIMNPSNGDFSSIDPNYTRAIALLDEAGIETIGYLYTLYTKRSYEDLQANIDAWKSFYQEHGISGFFLDEASNKKEDIAYYEDISRYAKQQGFQTIVLNPGTYVDQEYFTKEAFSAIVTLENSYENTTFKDPNSATQTTKKALLFYATQEQNGVYDLCTFALDGGYSYIYATDNDSPQRWDTLSSYIQESILALSRGCKQ